MSVRQITTPPNSALVDTIQCARKVRLCSLPLLYSCDIRQQQLQKILKQPKPIRLAEEPRPKPHLKPPIMRPTTSNSNHSSHHVANNQRTTHESKSIRRKQENETNLSVSLMARACANAPAVLATSKGLIRMAPLRRLEQAENSEASTTPADSGSPLAKMYSRGIRLRP